MIHLHTIFRYLLCAAAIFAVQYTRAQAPALQWQKRYGLQYSDCLKAICQTSDGGYISAGMFTVPGVAFSYNYGIVKTDSLGNLQWSKHYGGFVQDYANTILQTLDGGYIVGGNASSNNGDVSGNHGSTDIWILKLDAQGNVQWKKCYGGSGRETIGRMLQMPDGSYMVAGGSESVNGDLAGISNNVSFGYGNVWLFRLDASGNITWKKTYGGTSGETANDIKALPGGGFVVAGYSLSNNGDVSGNHGNADFWIFRTDAAGNIMWQKSLGGSLTDMATGIVAVPGGFVAAGYTLSPDGDVTGFHAVNQYDSWAVKLDTAGNLLWQKALGGSKYDMGMGIAAWTNGTVVIANSTNSTDGDVSAALGNADVWLTCLDSAGNLAWEKSFGGSLEDGYAFDQFGIGIIPAADGGLAISGLTASPQVPGALGGWDGYIIKLRKPQCDTVAAIHDTAFCAAQAFSLQLLPGATATTYTWSTGAHTAGIQVQDTGVYWRVASSGCSLGTDTFRVRNAVSVQAFVHDTLSCKDAEMYLAGSSGFDTYLWNTGDTAEHITATVAATYWRKAADECRIVTDTFTIHHKVPLPIPDLGPDRELCSDTHEQIGTRYPGVRYWWSTGDTSAYIQPAATGTYTVQIDNGCETRQDSVFVTVSDCSSCVFIPDAFTPNGDGRNDLFGVTPRCSIQGFSIEIYNRWGELMFVAYNTTARWDGTYRGTSMLPGVYFYYAHFTAPDGRLVNSKGDVTLIR